MEAERPSEPLTAASSSSGLSKEEVERYSRHVILPEFGLAGQEKLKAGSVLCVGAGGLGSPAAMYLAAAGVGRIGVVDEDAVDATNLQRQILHGASDVGRSKLASAEETLREINPFIRIVKHPVRLNAGNALSILNDYDVILDGSDNFPTRYLVNDACVLLGKPDVYGSIFRFEGQASVFWAEKGPCYRCLYPDPPSPGMIPSCAEAGVLGVLPGVIGTIQASEALKLLAGIGDPLTGRVLLYDALKMTFREISLARDPACPMCGTHPSIQELTDLDLPCEVPSSAAPALTPLELKAELDTGRTLFLLDVREPFETRISDLAGGVLIPLDQLEGRLGEVPRDADIVVYCRSGQRSGLAADFMSRQGFRVRNLTGGVLAWSDQVDASMPKY